MKKVFIRSGLRYDFLLADSNRAFFRELVEHHVSGQLKVAPEHCSGRVLYYMGKPSFAVFERFRRQYEQLNEKLGKKQYLVPYLMSSHPGSRLEDAIALAEYLNRTGHNPEQVQDFYPTPGTLSTAMYYSGLDPRTMKPVYVARDPEEKAMQRALLQWRRPEKQPLVRKALRLAGREDLIGYGRRCLVPPEGGRRPPVKSGPSPGQSAPQAGRTTPPHAEKEEVTRRSAQSAARLFAFSKCNRRRGENGGKSGGWGMSDRSFNPDGNVTRAEMAKMIYAVRMRGNTDAGNFAGLSTSFTDLYDTWYRGYVKWAQAAGIIDGKSATTFDPNGSVTGTEAAKMLLVLAGYTSDRAGLTGVNWETNTIRYASQAGLLDNMDNVDLSQALPREYAAQLIYNALFIPMVRWSNDSQSFEEITSSSQEGDTGRGSVTTIGLQYMDLRFFEGTFEGNYRTGAAGRDGYIKFTGTSGEQVNKTVEVQYDLDLAWIGEEVEVLYQDNNLRGDVGSLDSNDAIYGINKTGDTVVYNITKADLQNTTDGNGKIKFDGVNHNVASHQDSGTVYDLTVYVNYKEGTPNVDPKEFDIADDETAGTYYGKSADTIKFVTDDNGDITKAYIIDKTVSQIVSLTSSKINLRGNGFGVMDIDGEDKTVSLYEGAAKDDYVYCAEMYVRDPEVVVEKATTLDDLEVTAVKAMTSLLTAPPMPRVRRMIMRPAWISLLAPVSLRATSIKSFFTAISG